VSDNFRQSNKLPSAEEGGSFFIGEAAKQIPENKKAV
jgi:hypothetical protein